MILTFEAGYDIADLGGLALAIVETGGNTFNVAVAAGEFFPLTSAAAAAGDFADLVQGYLSLRAEVESQLNTLGDPAGAWTVTFDSTLERFVFTHDGGGGVSAVSITPTTNGGLLGVTGVLSGALAHQGQRVPDYWIQSDVGYWSEWGGEYEGGDDVAFDVEAHDGRPGGVAKDDAPTYLDLEVPSEPVAKVGNYPRLVVTATAPWTWKDLWKHCRNVEPIAMRDDDEVYFLLLRAEGSRFKPVARGDNYVGHWDLRFLTRVLARGT